MSKLLNRLQALRNQVQPVTVATTELGDVQLMPLFASQRMVLMREAAKKGDAQRDVTLLLIALSMSEDGLRLADQFNLDELIAMLDPLPDATLDLLWDEANKLSKVTSKDVEDASKNSEAPTG